MGHFGRSRIKIPESGDMQTSIQDLVDRELLQFDVLEHCVRCRRTLLVGEPVHVYENERIVCDICRSFELTSPLRVRLVHGPAFGQTIRIIDQRN
jgi:hypothetical protein